MNEKPEWFEDDEFWIAFAPLMFNEDRWADAPREAGQVLKLLEVPPAGTILDSCSGVGRHAVEFAKRGYRVTGVDRTGPYLEAAQETADAEGLRIEFVRDDVRFFRRPGFFNAAVNLFSSFGYFADGAEESRYLRNISDSLIPGGRFLVDVNGKEIAGLNFREKDWFEEGDMLVFAEYAVLENWSRLQNRWIILHGGERFERTFCYRLYSAAELTDLLLSNGFSHVHVYGGLDGRPYDRAAQRLVAVAGK